MKKILITLLVLGLMSYVISPVLAAIPAKMHIQGLLTDTSGNALSGSYTINVNVVSAGPRTTGFSLPGVSVSNGIFDIEFGDSDLRGVDFSAGDITVMISVNGVTLFEGGSSGYYQPVTSAPAALAAFNLKGGRVEALGSPAVDVKASDSWHSYLCNLAVIGIGDTEQYGALGQKSANTRGKMAYNRTTKYSGFNLFANEPSGNDVALYAYGRENGIFTRGQVALRADNPSGGGPALEIGPGRVAIPWGVGSWSSGDIYSQHIDIAPVSFTGPPVHSGAAGVVAFRNYNANRGGGAPVWTADPPGYTWNVINGQAKTTSLIFLMPRPGQDATYPTATTIATAEAYIANKSTGRFDIILKEPLPQNSYAEFSFLIINPHVDD